MDLEGLVSAEYLVTHEPDLQHCIRHGRHLTDSRILRRSDRPAILETGVIGYEAKMNRRHAFQPCNQRSGMLTRAVRSWPEQFDPRDDPAFA